MRNCVLKMMIYVVEKAEILGSPAMEDELQKLVRSTLRAPAVQEAAAEAVGGVSWRTASAAADRVLPWRWQSGRSSGSRSVD